MSKKSLEYHELREKDEPKDTQCRCCFCITWKCCGIFCAIFVLLVLIGLVIFFVAFGEEIWLGYKGYKEA